MGYVFLGLAIIACVAGSSALTASDGMVIKNGDCAMSVFDKLFKPNKMEKQKNVRTAALLCRKKRLHLSF